ncbi:MAG TPA: TonB-dependent receptor, partial [Kofleriaceae bacterium]|nr:TonB-dependent receptor [Kofleriaceae bacterium]
AADHSLQAGASVSVPGTNILVFTDEKGQYTIDVPAGTTTIHAEAPGQAGQDKPVDATGNPPALDFDLLEDQVGEVIAIVGSRTPRSKLETPVPVDIITAETISESGQTETNQLLNQIAPSFNASHQAVVDGTDHIDPADLRALGPEHVLVLVNGKRLHQSSLINVYSGGTVGVDLNAIPTSAIARIEVLRDGAASQYGSDAIAGVINIVLKDNVDTTTLYSQTGITYDNDGAQYKLGANTGFKLGDKGFVNLTGEFFSRGRTNRSGPYSGDIFPGVTGTDATNAELKRRGLTRSDFDLDVGTSGAIVGTAFLNAGYKLSSVFEAYAQAGFTERKGKASGFYRLPFQEERTDANIYPLGFLPEINPLLIEWTGTAGVRAKSGLWTGDLSATYGGDRFHFFVDHSLNASLGDRSPTHFDAGATNFHQTSVNLDATRAIEQPVLKSLSIVAGAELRREDYFIDAGAVTSYEAGHELTADGQPKAPGAQVFPGFRPADAHDTNRLSESAYLGLESQPTERTNLDVGGRFEHYSDFGSTVTGKVDGRAALIKHGDSELAIRGSASTGFRAPGVQQLGYSTIATQFVNPPGGGAPALTNILVSPNGSPVTQAFGAPQLKQETSVNFSGGATARIAGNFTLSADYYRVQIKNRVVLGGLFTTDDPVLGAAVQNIVAPFPGVAAAQFFINAVDTTTNGVDVVADYTVHIPKGSIKATAAANFTKTTVDNVNVPDSLLQQFAGIPGGEDRVREIFLGRYGRNRLEDLLPRQKGTLGLRWDYDGFSAGIRGNYYGPTEYHADAGAVDDEHFGAKVTFDVDIGYRIGGLWWSIGANNVFDTFPDQLKKEDNRDNNSFLYTPAGVPAGAPYGTDGGFYYTRVEYRF